MDRANQRNRILNLLADGGWVPLPRILELGIASHTRRIHELRKSGHEIEMADFWEGRQRRVLYRLVKA